MEAMKYLVAKKEIADAAKELKKEERFKKTFALQEERIRMERENMEFKRKVEEERIMNTDMSTLSYKHQQYYERHQDEIIVKRMNK
jgi:ribonucleotide monophosphatase NagD (HAD superfamily)